MRGLAPLPQALLGRLVVDPGRFRLLLLRSERLVELLETVLRVSALLLQLPLMRANFLELPIDLLAPEPDPFLRLTEPYRLELRFVQPGPQPLGGLALRLRYVLGAPQCGLDPGQLRDRLLLDQALSLQLSLQVLDLEAARQQTRLAIVGRVEPHSVPADPVPGGNHELRAGG